MKKIDSLGLKICKYQADLFEKSIKDTKSSSKIFIRRFMNSNLAKRMDNIGFLFDSIDIPDAIAELDTQYGASSYGIEKFSLDEMHWIGYIYRYWAYICEISSKQLYKKVKPEKLRKLYKPYHTLDPHQAIERIIEEIEPDNNVDDIAKGVIILRKIRKERRKASLV